MKKGFIIRYRMGLPWDHILQLFPKYFKLRHVQNFKLRKYAFRIQKRRMFILVVSLNSYSMKYNIKNSKKLITH